MNIQKNQNINFTSYVNIVDKADAKNPLLKPLINQLKHHAGGKDVFHTVQLVDGFVCVKSKYLPKTSVNGASAFVRHISSDKIGIDGPISKDMIEKLVEWSKGTKKWIQDVKNLEPTKMKTNEVEEEGVFFVNLNDLEMKKAG